MSKKPEETESVAESDEDNQEDSQDENEKETETVVDKDATEVEKEAPKEEPKKDVKEAKDSKKSKKASKDPKDVKKESKKEKDKPEESKVEEPVKETPKPPIKVGSFKATLKDSKMVKGLFEAVSSIISETRLKVDPAKGLFMTAMDGSHICLVSLTLKKEDFDAFEAEEEFELGLNLEDLTKILKRADSKDEITFSVDKVNKRLIVQMKPESAKKARTFKIALMDIEVEEVNMETLSGMSFENIIEMNSDFLDEAIKDAEIFSEALVVKAKGNAVVFSTEGSLGDMEYELNKDELTKATFTKDGGCTYGIQFLKSILKIAGIQKNFEVQFGNEQPLHISVKLLKNSEIVYFLAPRVDEDPNIGSEE